MDQSRAKMIYQGDDRNDKPYPLFLGGEKRREFQPGEL